MYFFSKLIISAVSWLSRIFVFVSSRSICFYCKRIENAKTKHIFLLVCEVSAILRSGRNKTKSKKSKKKKDSANDDTIIGASGAADTSSAVV